MYRLLRILLLFVATSYMAIINGQQCPTNGLQNPPSIEWTPSPSSPTTFSATLTVSHAIKTWNNNAVSLTTRVFNDQLPGPTLRLQRGNTYKVTLVNDLDANPAGNELLTGNQERDPNTINLHTHGLHISGAPGADYVLLEVPPVSGSDPSVTYTYNIPCTHSGGMHWYHPHHHPSVGVQLGGGAAGVIIVEDHKNIEGLADWYWNMRELIFWITHLSATFINTHDVSTLHLTPNNDVFLVNGEYAPTVCMEENEWIKFRFGQSEMFNPQRYAIGNTGDCTFELLARDGVIINGGVPRTVGNIVWLSEGSRADVAITCATAGTYSITALDGDADARNGAQEFIIAYIQVYSGSSTATTLTSFTPNRPSYLTDLSSATVDNTLSMKLRADSIAVGGLNQQFGIEANPYFTGVASIAIDSVNEWTLIRGRGSGFGNRFHAFHIHVNHFQVMTDVGNDIPGTDQPQIIDAGYQQVGDWLDTYWGSGVIRFKPDIWGGPVVIHCHKIAHEISGVMGAVFISDGCDYDYTGYNGATCGFDSNSCTTAAPTKAPTASPTITTKSPTENPSRNPRQSTKLPTSSCIPNGELNCSQDADCCDNWCDLNGLNGANPKCKRPPPPPPGKGAAKTKSVQDGNDDILRKNISGKTRNGLYVISIVVIVVSVLLIGLSILGYRYICYRRKSKLKEINYNQIMPGINQTSLDMEGINKKL